MSVRIRLRRMGRKKQPHYRVVVADSRAPRDGRIVENLGYYRPKATPARLVLDLERVDYWIGHGAKPSETVSSLVRRARQGGGPELALGEPEPEAHAARRAEEQEANEAAEPAEPAQPGEETHSQDSASAVEAAAGGEDEQEGAPRAEAEDRQQAGESDEDGAAEGAGRS